MGVFSDMMMIMMTYSPWRPGSCNEPGAGSGGAIVPSTTHLHCCAHCLPTSGVGVLGRGRFRPENHEPSSRDYGLDWIDELPAESRTVLVPSTRPPDEGHRAIGELFGAIRERMASVSFRTYSHTLCIIFVMIIALNIPTAEGPRGRKRSAKSAR